MEKDVIFERMPSMGKSVQLICLLLSLQAMLFAQDAKLSTVSSAQIVAEKLPFPDSSKRFRVERVRLNSARIPQISIKSKRYKKVQDVPWKNSLPKSVELQTKLSIDRKVPYALVFVPNYILNDRGEVLELQEIEFDVRGDDVVSQKTSGNRVYATNSVLASGDWYKIAINDQGLYKIDYDFLNTQLGIDMATINPSQIRLFGNGGEMLPEDNAIFRQDDLFENAIELQGMNDGKFDPGDYILFYANGPHTIHENYTQKKFAHSFNVYSEASYYFLNFNQAQGKRLTNSVSPGPASLTTTTASYFDFYEKDSTSIGRAGKNWWGVDYSTLPGRYLNRSVSFAANDLDFSEPLLINTNVGAVSTSGTNSFVISANGSTVHSIPLNSIGLSFADPYIRVGARESAATINSSPVNIGLQFVQGNSSATGYLNFIELNGRQNLKANSFRWFADWNSVAPNAVVQYDIDLGGQSSAWVWDVSDPLEPVQMTSTTSGGTVSFTAKADSLQQYISFDRSSFSAPSYLGQVPNQNLHNSNAVDYLIISEPSLKSEAERLGAHHAAKRGYTYEVVSPEQIYNEFSSGSQDVVAIRDFIKMYYDKGTNPTNTVKNVLLFGDASYDYKDRLRDNTNYVPVYETNESVNKSLSYCSDDFYGFLDDLEDVNNYSIANTTDIGIGRIPAGTVSEARGIVDKIIAYDSPASFGSWKNVMAFNADDQDTGIHLDDAEIMSNYVKDSLPDYNVYKIYVDAFNQESTPAGPRTPDAQRSIKDQLFNGTFVVNYNGHGGPLGWCEERILTLEDIQALRNQNKLPLFITATCDFTQFDNPNLKSAGEYLMSNPEGGAIALMTTTQLVYQAQNRTLNASYFRKGFTTSVQKPTLGDAYRESKNLTYVNSISQWDAANFRKFALVGDPGLPLAFPQQRVVTDSINGVWINDPAVDTLKALGRYTISGHLEDNQGNALLNFDGEVLPTLFDKKKVLSTLQNDADSPLRNFEVQNNILYRGRASVESGKFNFTFVMPKDINYNVDYGKLSYYADNDVVDAAGNTQVLIGGSSQNAATDNQGPDINPFMNDEAFANGGIVLSNSLLLIKLFDENGINYSGNSVGHDITAVLDNNAQQSYVLNNFYESEKDSFQAGTVRFPVEGLTEGPHTFKIKAWDVYNNSSEALLDFVVVNDDKAELEHVYNYPNPFSTNTRFMFEHNLPNQNLNVTIKIFSMTGQVVKVLKQTINTSGTRFDGIEWNGTDQYGRKLGNGTYLYKLSFKSQNGLSKQKLQKLIILR